MGGARARDVVGEVNLSDQVGAFLIDSGGAAPPDALYVVDMGGNDIRDALEVFDPSDPTAAFTVIGTALTKISDNIVDLYLAGAEKFLVLNVPDLGPLPAIQMLDDLFPGAAAGATFLTGVFNTGFTSPSPPIDLPGLTDVLDALEAGLPGIEIVRADVSQTFDDMLADPGAFGLRNVVDPCIMPDGPPFFCRRPKKYLFWDGIHPTKAVHAILAEEAALALGVECDPPWRKRHLLSLIQFKGGFKKGRLCFPLRNTPHR